MQGPRKEKKKTCGEKEGEWTGREGLLALGHGLVRTAQTTGEKGPAFLPNQNPPMGNHWVGEKRGVDKLVRLGKPLNRPDD